ncbi:MAG TPA: hypothetical protein VLJ19_20810 [Variovorax sp.]|nr:hypothetical protein [Variovorax sp.]
MNKPVSIFRLWPLALVAALSGCATSWTVDSNVASFARPPGPTAPATYRFERLPSQQAQEATQLELEAMAGMAMASVGLTRDDASARYSAEITARVSVEASPWADPWFYGGWGPGWGYGYGRAWGPYGAYGPYGPYGRGGWYGGYGGWYGPAYNPWYSREVSVVLRELPGNRIVYETRARNDGPYSANGPVFAAMFQAAMHGYPNPPAGMRRVDVTIPTGQAATTAQAPAAAPATPVKATP